MVDPGARPSSWTSLALAIVLSLLAPACQSTVSVEGAKKITTQFGGAPNSDRGWYAPREQLADRDHVLRAHS